MSLSYPFSNEMKYLTTEEFLASDLGTNECLISYESQNMAIPYYKDDCLIEHIGIHYCQNDGVYYVFGVKDCIDKTFSDYTDALNYLLVKLGEEK